MSEFPCPTIHAVRGGVDKAGKPSVDVCVLDMVGWGGGGARWEKELFVGWLINVQASCSCISGTMGRR